MKYDAIVIGGAFAGLSAALQLGRARRSVLVIDAGRPRNRFARHSHGFLGQDGRTPAEILATARGQLAAYSTVAITSGEAVEARPEAADSPCRSRTGETSPRLGLCWRAGSWTPCRTCQV